MAPRLNLSRTARVVRSMPLAPDIVEAVLDGRQGAGITPSALIELLLVDCAKQRLEFAPSA